MILLILTLVAAVGTSAVIWWTLGRESEPRPGFSIGRQVTDTLRSDEALGAFLSRHGVDSTPVLAALAGATVDPGTLAGGWPITMFRESDSAATTEISWQIDDDNRVKLGLDNRRWTARIDATQWTSEVRIIAGTLDDSLMASISSGAASRSDRPFARVSTRSGSGSEPSSRVGIDCQRKTSYYSH